MLVSICRPGRETSNFYPADCRSGEVRKTEILLIAAGVACLAYFLFLLAFGMDFAIVWALMAAFFAGLAVAWHQQKAGIWHIPVWGRVLAGVLITAGVVVLAAAEVCIAGRMDEKGKPGLDYIIVLGAQVHGEVPSLALEKRLEVACRYLKENTGTKAILSGGKGSGENITEAESMERYLVEKGIGKERLIKEEKSVSTAENLEFSADIIGDKNASVGIVSNNFHICRALSMAQKQDYRDVCGIAAPSDARFQVHYMLREGVALIVGKLTGKL